MEEEGARWPHRSSKPAWQPLRLPEGSTPSPLRQQSARFASVFQWSATGVPTCATQMLAQFAECRSDFALRADRVAAVHALGPPGELHRNRARHARALE